MRKSDKLDISKSKLIEATMELMDACVNPIEVTSRTIASKAGVQVAMIIVSDRGRGLFSRLFR